MSPTTFSAISTLLQGALLMALSVPMIRGRVKPNALYGFRTRKTLSSPEIWYKANAAGGKALFVAGAVSAAASAVVLLLGSALPESVGTALPTATLLASVVAATAYSLLALSKM